MARKDAKNIVIAGASGGIGSAMTAALAENSSNRIWAFSRTAMGHQSENVHCHQLNFCDETALAEAAQMASTETGLDLVLVATGFLHDLEMGPEKSLKELSIAKFERNFVANTIVPALVAKHFLPLLAKDRTAIFAALSARVGSITDNHLGGWYSYRASKAALNMLLKTASIEMQRSNKNAVVVGLHPGTVATPLSDPFQKNVPPHKLFSPRVAADQLLSVLNGLTTKHSGTVVAWDATAVPP